jgi:DNA mismatch repair protein MutL
VGQGIGGIPRLLHRYTLSLFLQLWYNEFSKVDVRYLTVLTMSIRVLPPEVASKIAAGEVIERPASVVKELIENALDAGATEIRIEVRDGGQRLVRVADDGSGIPAAETELAFARHATSKLRTADDLERIVTLGFRGEALASIAAVSQVTLLTRARGEAVGTFLRLEEGRMVRREERGAPPGTIVTVENLFFNLPARRKFLRSLATEGGRIHEVVSHYALAFPERRFSLVSDGRLAFQTTGSGKMYDVLVKVMGLETAKQMLEVGEPQTLSRGVMNHALAQAIRVSGYVSAPSLNRASRTHITLFLNRRWIQDRNLAYAVIQAYHTLLPVGRYPIAVLLIEMDPGEVDVNVHPAKAEVRFRDASGVFQAVQRAVRRALADQAPIPTIGPPTAFSRYLPSPSVGERRGPGGGERSGRESGGPAASQMALDLHRPMPQTDEPLFPPPTESAQQGESDSQAGVGQTLPLPTKIPPLRVLGQMGQMYIVAEGPEGMYLIDQHAAHERVLFERLLADRAAASVPSQNLLEPAIVELAPAQAAVLNEALDALTGVGFVVEPFGGTTFLLRAVPAILAQADPVRSLLDVVSGLAESEDLVGEATEARVALMVCKQGAVKAGQVLSLAEMQQLVRQLEATQSPRTCPHGRPTMLHLSAAQLAREFGRKP